MSKRFLTDDELRKFEFEEYLNLQESLLKEDISELKKYYKVTVKKPQWSKVGGYHADFQLTLILDDKK